MRGICQVSERQIPRYGLQRNKGEPGQQRVRPVIYVRYYELHVGKQRQDIGREILGTGQRPGYASRELRLS